MPADVFRWLANLELPLESSFFLDAMAFCASAVYPEWLRELVSQLSLAGGVEPGDGPALTLEMGWSSWLSSLGMLEMAAIVVSGGW